MRKFISRLKRKPLLLAVSLVAVVGLAGLGVNHAMAGTTYQPDCSVNSIVKCGAGTPASFISKVQSNNDGYGHHDLQSIYAYFGLKSSDYANFSKYAEEGTFNYANGTLTVAGQVVGTNVWGVGRTSDTMGGAKRTPFTIDGKTYYKSPAVGRAYKGTLSGMVYFNSKGEVQFATEHACGNPMPVTPVKPTYSCNLLQKKSLGNNTYSFTTSASASHNAKISHVVYNFGDGSSTVSTTSLSTPVTHKYTKSGSFTTTVTVYVHVPGNHTVTVTSAHCATKITVTPPPKPVYACKELTASQVDRTTYNFTASGTASNGATITGYAYSFDGSAPQSGGSTVKHSFSQAGSHTVRAYAVVSVNGKTTQVTSDNCVTTVNVAQAPAASCKDLKLTLGEGRQVQAVVSYNVSGGAKLVNIVYDFGDGHTQNTSSTTVSHTYTKDGSYTVKATLTFAPATVSVAHCQASVGIATPAYSCNELNVQQGDDRTVTVRNLNTSATNGAQFKDVVIDWGDGTSTTTTKTSGVSHQYAQYGNYNIKATAEFMVNGKVVTDSGNCAAQVSFNKPPVCQYNKNLPPNSPDCVPPCQYNKNLPSNSPKCVPPVTPCQYNSNLPANSPECVPPVLANTGAGSMIGLFAGTSLVAGLGYSIAQKRRLFTRG